MYEKKSDLTKKIKETKDSSMVSKLKIKLTDIENELDEIISFKNKEKVKEYVKECEAKDGKLSQQNLWKLKKKLCPTSKDPPTAKLDNHGNMITAPETL